MEYIYLAMIFQRYLDKTKLKITIYAVSFLIEPINYLLKQQIFPWCHTKVMSNGILSMTTFEGARASCVVT